MARSRYKNSTIGLSLLRYTPHVRSETRTVNQRRGYLPGLAGYSAGHAFESKNHHQSGSSVPWSLCVTEPVGDGVFEMKLDFGPGFRVYYAVQDRKIIFLLGGGSKARQQNDIDQAKALWKSYKVQQK